MSGLTAWVDASGWHAVMAVASALGVLVVLIGAAFWAWMRERPAERVMDRQLDAVDPTLEVHHGAAAEVRAVRAADVAGPDPYEAGVAAGAPGVPAGGPAVDRGPVAREIDDERACDYRSQGAAGAPGAAGAGQASVRLAVLSRRSRGVRDVSEAGDEGSAEALRLTPAQRRRAIHKGRIPRELPPSLAGVVPPAAASRPAGEHHERLPAPLTVWEPWLGRYLPVFPTLLESVSWEAHWQQFWWGAEGHWAQLQELAEFVATAFTGLGVAA